MKQTAIKKALTKTQLIAELAEYSGLTKKEVTSVMQGLENVVHRHVKPRSAGQFTLPGLLKIKTVKKPASPARKGVPNPFRPGELMDIPAKPASKRIRVTPLKALKDAIN